METPIQSHYACPDLTERIRAGLSLMGKSLGKITPKTFGPVDQLHTGGAPATIALAGRIGLPPGSLILDAGCGLGGSSRILAERFKFQVEGIDLSYDFIETANIMTQWCCPDASVRFRQGSVTDLPYENGHFDAVLCQHILMNIEDKPRVLAQFFRVLKPGGKLILHEIFKGPGPEPLMPVPWASDPSTSFLPDWDWLEAQLICTGFHRDYFCDHTGDAVSWWKMVNAVQKNKGRSPLNPGLVFGKNARYFGHNMKQNFSAGAILCIESVFIK